MKFVLHVVQTKNLLRRYIDDKRLSPRTKFLNDVNSERRKISFTIKHEENNSLSLLNITFFHYAANIHLSLERTIVSTVLTDLQFFFTIFLQKFYVISTL